VPAQRAGEGCETIKGIFMARVTVEDCLSQVENRFHLVLIAAKLARRLALGSVEAIVPWENHKPTVIALQSIAKFGVMAALEPVAPVESSEDPTESEI
jgi:DNA-directed RNA polymerase subunit omega